MPRQYRGPRLWLDRERKTWTILDGRSRIRTGFSEFAYDEAKKALRAYADSVEREPGECEPPPNTSEFEHGRVMEPGDRFITLHEAAKTIFGGKTSYETLRREVKNGRLTGWKFGGRVMTSVNSARRLYDGTTRLKPSTNGRGVYIIGFGPYVKIGITLNLEKRISYLQPHVPEPVEVYAIFSGWRRDEIMLHTLFADQRLQGEWFLRKGALAEWIDGGCS